MGLFDSMEKQIKEVTEGAEGAEVKKTLFGCLKCREVFEQDTKIPPTNCPLCSEVTAFATGATPAEVKSSMIKKIQAATKAATKTVSEETVVAVKTDTAVVAEESASDKRKKLIEELVRTKKLNETIPVSVGFGQVDAPGFSVWKDGKPNYRFFEVEFDTPESFGKSFEEARKSGMVELDVYRITKLSPEIHPLAYRGLITVSKNNGKEIVRAKVGDTIEIGATLSKNKSLIFSILKIKKAGN